MRDRLAHSNFDPSQSILPATVTYDVPKLARSVHLLREQALDVDG